MGVNCVVHRTNLAIQSLMIYWFSLLRLKHKLWPKERPRVKFPIWLLTTKSQESPWFICVKVMCHISLESSWRRLQLCFKIHLNRRFAQEVIGLQSHKKSQFREFRDSQLASLGTKWHLGASNVARHREYYKGEGGGLSKVRAVVSLVSSCLPMVRLCTKRVFTMLWSTSCCLVCAGLCE
jgi:hypothetical protein